MRTTIIVGAPSKKEASEAARVELASIVGDHNYFPTVRKLPDEDAWSCAFSLPQELAERVNDTPAGELDKIETSD